MAPAIHEILNYHVTTGVGVLLWSLVCVTIRLSSYDDNQIVWLSVFNDCQHAAFYVVLSFPCLICMLAVSFNLVVRIQAGDRLSLG